MAIARELLQPVEKDRAELERLVRPSVSYWRDAWRRLKMNRLAMLGLAMVLFLLAAAILGPILSPYGYDDQDLGRADQPPSMQHPCGTDRLGRDLLVRVLYGARISLSIGFVSSLINLTIGVAYGAISGFAGGRLDELMMRVVDILYAIPTLLVVIMLMVVLGSGLTNIYIALGISYWLTMARIVRGQILTIKEQEYVLAARLIGVPYLRVLWKHLIPNAMGPIIVYSTLSIPNAIFLEAFLSFIGLGVAAPRASWGTLASEGIQSMRSYPWQLFFPALAISICLLGFNFLGDGLRDALDPRLRK
ncbi:MAG TPA: ABC transporter permease [Firmicutes bacterium]|nr:ABC transporter permease [Bacillota bacterium]